MLLLLLLLLLVLLLLLLLLRIGVSGGQSSGVAIGVRIAGVPEGAAELCDALPDGLQLMHGVLSLRLLGLNGVHLVLQTLQLCVCLRA